MGLNPLGGGAGPSHQTPASRGSEFQNQKAIREKFQRYLTLLYHDLCAKTNGLTKKEIDEYTFLKVSTPFFNTLRKSIRDDK